MKDDTPQRVRDLQAYMKKLADPFFAGTQLVNLDVLIQITLEFRDYLDGFGAAPELEPRHTCEAIFGRIEFFTYVMCGYKSSFGQETRQSRIGDTVSMSSLKQQFLPLFDEFLAEEDFERKCSLLLDLFELQIVFAA